MGSGAELRGVPSPDPAAEELGGKGAFALVKRRRRNERAVLAAVAVGGALGAPARYGVSLAVHVTPGTLPWGTFWTNVAGSFALGFLLTLLVERFPPSRFVRPFVATGFLGAFTTYSTFAVETDLLMKNGHVAVAAAYALGSLAAGFTAVWVGIVVAGAIPKRRRRSHEA
jgi:CrcB protein